MRVVQLADEKAPFDGERVQLADRMLHPAFVGGPVQWLLLLARGSLVPVPRYEPSGLTLEREIEAELTSQT